MIDADHFVGKTINNRYEIVSRIKQLPGEWFRAKSLKDGSDVSLTMFWHYTESFEPLKEHFSKPLKHQNIVTSLDFGVVSNPNFFYIAMDAIDGEPLSAILDGDPCNASFIASVFEQVGAGVKAAHSHGIIHGALDPNNIIIRAAAGTPLVRVMNFGVHPILESHKVIDDREPEINFNPHYYSPEQIQGKTPTERSDVHALGCLLYSMLCGHPPHGEKSLNALEVLMAKLLEEPKPISEVRSDVAPALEKVVMKSMSIDPAHRHASVDELVMDFRRA